MVKNLGLVLCLLLASCSEQEYHGHYGVNFEDINQGESFEDIKSKFNSPIQLPFNDGVVYYIGTSHTVKWMGAIQSSPTNNLRVEIKNDIITDLEKFLFVDAIAIKKYTKGADKKIKFFSEVFGDIGKIRGPSTKQ